MSEHSDHMMHNNSLEVHQDNLDSGAYSKREMMILNWHRMFRRPSTDRQVQKALGFKELARVQPRISELIDRGVLAEVGSTIDGTTGKRVRLVGLAEKRSEAVQEALF